MHVPHVFAPKLIPPKYFYVSAPGMCEYRHYINTEGRGQSANTYFKNNSSKIFSCIRTHANTGPTCIRAKINSSRIFSCMYRFCAGGYPKNTILVFWGYSGGYLQGYFGDFHVLPVGGYFCISRAFLFCSWSRGCQTLGDFYLRICLGICIEKWRGILVNFWWSLSLGK